ncbi:hypothetical protein E4U42_001246 [Claviceps africana]|uniref:Uncharacterized protein n=1 Tax=Claviceps africana TaxID=83212 RepID=A0A8K0NEI1_9HYPO|nr:hypothetical protein E4U42_001246 [Claviceps africana]
MGNHLLSSTLAPRTAPLVLDASDRAADILLLAICGSALYACAVIYTTCVLVDRWKGPADKVRVGPGSVLVALVVSSLWPVVMVYMIFEP